MRCKLCNIRMQFLSAVEKGFFLKPVRIYKRIAKRPKNGIVQKPMIFIVEVSVEA